jgi:hypothetical protein
VREPEIVAARSESDLILKARDEAGLWCVMRMCWHCEPDARAEPRQSGDRGLAISIERAAGEAYLGFLGCSNK